MIRWVFDDLPKLRVGLTRNSHASTLRYGGPGGYHQREKRGNVGFLARLVLVNRGNVGQMETSQLAVIEGTLSPIVELARRAQPVHNTSARRHRKVAQVSRSPLLLMRSREDG